MLEKLSQLSSEIDSFKAANPEETEQFRIKFLGQKGILKTLFEEFKNIPPEEKKLVGQKLNELKNKAQEKYNSLKLLTEKNSALTERDGEGIDLTLPVSTEKTGSRHPVSIVKNEIIEIFSRLGYVISEGPEIEDDWHNFSALNFPEDHPARDMQDTFFISEFGFEISDLKNGNQKPETRNKLALRTHTSSVQVRVMENQKPPIRTISPGRVFRNEAISARAHCIFHQVEGLYIDENVSFADLKQTLLYFSREMFGEKTQIRLRPSYFPFTEPSAEMDITCFICSGSGCPVCKHSGWVEILGCGMVDPAVLENCKIDSNKYTGFAFGMGIERIAMLKYRINDIRLMFENDVRFLRQFGSAV